MKKKIIALFVSAMLLGAVATGCGKDESTKNKDTKSKVEDKTDNKDESNKTGNDSTKEVKDNSLIVKNEFPLPLGDNAIESDPSKEPDEKILEAIEKEADKITTLGDKFVEIMFNSTPETVEANIKKIEPFSSEELKERFPKVKATLEDCTMKLISIEGRKIEFDNIVHKEDSNKKYEAGIYNTTVNYEYDGEAVKSVVRIYFIVNSDTKAYEILSYAIQLAE